MNWRGLANYMVPKIDVLVSGILRSQANTSAGAEDRGHQRRLAVGELHRHQRPGCIAALGRPLAAASEHARST